MFSPGEVSDMLDVPTSTLRRWARQFTPFLSGGARKRRRRYSQKDLTIFARIRDFAAQNMSMDDIAGELEGIIDQISEEPDQTALTLPGLLNRLEDFAQHQKDQDDRISELQERIDRLERERAMLWYKRIFRRDDE